MQHKNVKEIALTIKGHSVAEEHMTRLAAHSEKLQFLSLGLEEIDTATLRPLAGKSLKEFEIAELEDEDGDVIGSDIGPEEANAITQISNLEKLSLKSCYVEEFALSCFEHSNLASLSLYGSTISQADLEVIAKIGTLKELNLGCASLDCEDVIPMLCGLTQLQCLAIDRFTSITAEERKTLMETMGNRILWLE